MKKILLIFAAIAALTGCKKPEAPIILPEDVQITISYSLDTSVGSDMTKSSDAELWQKFYDKMKSGEFVAPSYSLTFTEKKSGAKYKFDGKWVDKDIIILKAGEYNVTGTSHADGKYIQEQASISFNTDVTVSATQPNIVLPASYDCFLLAFPKADITSIVNHVSYESNIGGKTGESVHFYTFENSYYAYSRKIYNSSYPDESYIKGTKEDKSTFTIYTADLAFEKGKYYFYTAASSIFSLPEMSSGE